MFNWSVMGNPLRKEHYEKLSHFISDKLSIPNELQLLEIGEENFAEELNSQLSSKKSIRFDFPFPRLVFKSFEQFPADLMFLRAADCALKQNKNWWLRSLLTEAIHRLIIQSQVNIDHSGKAVVVGTGAGARASIMALVKFGMSHLNVVSIDKPAFDILAEDFRRFCFNVDLNFIPPENIKILGREHNVLINSTPLGPENTLLEDLAFFNYLTEKAIIIDLNFGIQESPLVIEATSLGHYVFTGLEIMLHRDLYWLEVALEQRVNFKVFQEFFKG